MINVLLFDRGKKHASLIEDILNTQVGQEYEIHCHSEFFNEIFSDSYFEVVLILDDRLDQIDLELIKQVVHLEIPAPIILISANQDQQLDDTALHLGAADSIPLDELSTSILERTIRHAIGRKNSEAQLSFLATHDQLTGLANRFLFHEHLTRTIGIAKRHHSTFGLLFLDLDRFKSINDSLGHDVGDMLLVEIASRIKQAVRVTDVVARVGGDEFTVLLEDAKNKQELAMIAKKIQLAIEPVINVRNHDLYATTSIGIAYFPECGLEPQSLMKSADIALYKAKEIGRNNFQFFTNDLNEKSRLKLELEKHLRRALIKGEFEIYFQPQVNASDHMICGVEALLRWNHPTMGLVSPIDFIPLLEELGLMVSVEQWVIKQVCLIAKRITDQYGGLRFAINISGSHFKLGDLKQSIYLALQESSLDASYLEIELTEDIMIEHVERNNNLLTELSEIGISIALDDFGKGYSSLSYLKNFPANTLKIDKAFIDNILSDGRESAIVESMIDLSHKLGIKVVAEGVEFKEQAKVLANKHCDFIQGYYFAKPMTLFDLESHLEAAFKETVRR